MNKNIFKKTGLTLSTLMTPIVITPFVISCSYNIKNGSLNRVDQEELMNSQYAKQSVFDQWLTDTYTNLYYEHFLKEDYPNNKKEVVDELKNFITYLDSSKVKILKKEYLKKFAKLIYDQYKFYVVYYSSINTSSSENNDSSTSLNAPAATYFLNKSLDWKKNKLTTTNGKTLDELNIGIGIMETKDSWEQDNTFKLIFTAHGTEIYANILKMLIARIYFLNSNENEIKQGTNYLKQTQKNTSLEYLKATSFDIKDPTYFLAKYLVEKNPQFKWSNSSNSSIWQNIFDYNDFNDLMGTTKTKLQPLLTPNSFDQFGNQNANSLSLLKGFTSLSYSSDTTGDLSNDIDSIKLYGYQKSGLLFNETKTLFSFKSLEARQKITKIIEANQNSLGLPAIKLTDVNKNVRNISLTDFVMTYNNIGPFTADKELEAKDTYNQKWQVIKLSFIPQSSSDNQKVNLTIKYTFEDNGKTYTLFYNFDFVWNKNGVQSNIFEKDYQFSNDNETLAKMFPSYIVPGVSQKLNFSYILRPLPIFNVDDPNSNVNNTININEKIYMVGKFSFKNTIWNDDEKRTNLVNWFILNDNDLWKTIQDFYLFNNYYMESSNLTFNSIISSLGLSKKTDNDRREAGILF